MLEMFQDDLLLKAIEFLLSVPTKILKQIYLNNINVLKKIFFIPNITKASIYEHMIDKKPF